MPNMLPLLLLGGAAVVVVASGKKTGGKPGFSKYIRVGPGCKVVYIEGADLFTAALKAEEDGVMIADKFRTAVQKAMKEEIFPLMDTLELDPNPLKGSMQLLRATFPSCSVSIESMKQEILRLQNKKIKSTKQALAALKPMISRLFMLSIMLGAYVKKMVVDGKITQEEAENLARNAGAQLSKELGDVDAVTDKDIFGEAFDLDPNTMAMRRPSFIDRMVMLSL